MRDITSCSLEGLESLGFVRSKFCGQACVEGGREIEVTLDVVFSDEFINLIQDETFVCNDFQGLVWTVERRVVLEASKSI
jgi:hypothetical protein